MTSLGPNDLIYDVIKMTSLLTSSGPIEVAQGNLPEEHLFET